MMDQTEPTSPCRNISKFSNFGELQISHCLDSTNNFIQNILSWKHAH